VAIGARPGRGGALLAVLTCLLLSAAPRAACAGAWTRAPGGFYVRAEVAGRSTDEEFDAAGRRQPYVSGLSPGEYRGRALRLYGEYGLAPGWTVTGSTAWQSLEVEERAAVWTTRGLSDVRLGLRRRLAASDWVSAVALEIKIPTGYDTDDFPGLGSGDADAALALQLGRSFGRAWGTGEAGVNVRGGALAEELFGSIEGGMTAAGPLDLRAGLRYRRALTGNRAQGSFDPSRVDARSLDLSTTASWRVTPRLALEVGATRTLSGRRTLTGTEWSAALAVQR
jgi:hypothetical protein